MRQLLLATAATLLIGGSAFAQGYNTTAPQGAQQTVPMSQTPAVSGQTGTGSAPNSTGTFVTGTERGTTPRSAAASNIGPSDTHSLIAPALPTPAVGPDASSGQLLAAAQQALQQHRTGAAQEALERAETRALDRSTAPSQADVPDRSQMVEAITQARKALGAGDLAQAQQYVSTALSTRAASVNTD